MTHEDENMTDTERLAHRFVDQELTADERVQFLARLSRDGAFREHVIEMEELLVETSRLPPVAVPSAFVAGVLAKIEPPAQASAERRTWLAHLLTPRTLQWNLAGALAALLLIVVAGALAVTTGRPEPGASASISSTPVLVRLVVMDADARTVQVAGDFNGWDPSRTSLERVSDAAWAVTIALEPGRYEYMFVVDGQRWIADPFAGETNDDGFGSTNAVLDVSAARGAPL
jgi:anti-sigma-K factor RskA